MAADEQPGLDWLRSLIEGDMALAKNAVTPGSGISPEWNEPSSGVLITGDGTDLDGLWSLGDSRLSRHIATHDPRDTIARCEAELAILDEHLPVTFTDLTLDIYDMQVCTVCHARLDEPDDYEGDDWAFPLIQMPYPCRTVRLLESGYKNRPGYTVKRIEP